MATTAPMQNPVSRMRMTPSSRPLTPLLQPSQSHRLLEALRLRAGGRSGGGSQCAGKGKVRGRALSQLNTPSAAAAATAAVAAAKAIAPS